MDWKQLRTTASDVAGKMVVATGELVEKGKKQVDILSLENQLAKAQRQLGALVYTMNRSGAENPALMQRYMEEIKIHMRGHNLYDIYYGRYKENEREILSRYIDAAPREDFADILDSIDRFIYFESRKRSESGE